MDIHTAANARSDLAIKSCFWPGPRAHSGVYTNDGASFALENQLPDTATTYIPTASILPTGATMTFAANSPACATGTSVHITKKVNRKIR
jgi:hypothetical protein